MLAMIQTNGRLIRAALPLIALCALAASAQASTRYTYDDLGRLSLVVYDNGTRITYTYDAAGNRTTHVSAAGTANRAPVAVADNRSGTVYTHTFDPRVNDSDPDADPLVIFDTTSPANGTVVVLNNGTQIRYTRTSNFPGPEESVTDLFTYTIHDGKGDFATANIRITISNNSCPPTGCL